MNNIFSYYTKYSKHIDEYNRWNKDNSNNTNGSLVSAENNSENTNLLKKKAKTIAEPLLLHDRYEHEKAEDAETFCQTLNIELMSISGALASLPISVTKIIPLLNKFSDKNQAVKKSVNLLEKYKNTSFNIAGKNISLPKAAAVISTIGSAVFYANGIKKSMETQHGIIRKASFDATQNIIDDPKMFAILTPQQEQQVKSATNNSINNNYNIVDKLKDKINVNSSFKEAAMYKMTYNDYSKKKSDYMKNINSIPDKELSLAQAEEAKLDNQLFINLLKNVEHDSLEPLRKIETIANISYSALFTGGFLEYLITDKLVKVLGIKNKALSWGIKLGSPILTYLLLNKNISNLENKAILAVKYKHLNEFIKNPEKYNQQCDEDKKENLVEFLKTISSDIKDYEKFSQNELPLLKNKMEAKRTIELTPEQTQNAETLQKNTSMVLNNQREELLNQEVGISALSETILGPIDIAATAIGGFIGHNLAKKCNNKKLSGALTGLGAITAFIPAAILEAELTKQQKLSQKISVMLAIKNLQNPNKFARSYNKNSSSFLKTNDKCSQLFEEFLK